MAIQTVACPQCQTALRSKRPLASNEMVRCPQCGNHFLAAPAPAITPTPAPAVVTPAATPTWGNRSFLLLLIPAACAALLLGGGAVLGTYLLVRPHPGQTPVVDDPREKEMAEKQRLLDEQEKQLATQKAKLSEKERRQEFLTQMRNGDKALEDKKYKEALTCYEAARKLYPNDQDALAGRDAAKAGLTMAAATETYSEEQKKRKAAFDKQMELGQQAMTAKNYAEAVLRYTTAVSLMPSDDDAMQALANAQKALEKDTVEKDKLAAYQKFIAAGKAAMDNGRYTDAVREYLGAQGVIPGDAVAVKGQKDAEQKLADAKTTADVGRLVDNGRAALNAKKYDEAIGGAQAALRLAPNDPNATQLLTDAKKALADAQTEYNRLLALAGIARAAQRYEEAKALYTQALLSLPGDAAALKAQLDMQNQIDGQAAYLRFMNAGAQALAANRYGDAATAYSEALRLVPNDVEAQKGLLIAQAALARIADYNRFMTIAAAAMTNKLYNDAVVAYRDALKAVPDDPLALAGHRQAKYLRAMAEGDKAMAAIPKKFTEAIAAYDEALKENPGDKTAKDQRSTARYLRANQDGTAFLVAKKFADAVPQFEDALKERPKDVDVTIKLRDAKFGRAMAAGDAAMTAQKYDDAVAAYQDALKVQPNDSKAVKALALAQQKLKKP